MKLWLVDYNDFIHVFGDFNEDLILIFAGKNVEYCGEDKLLALHD